MSIKTSCLLCSDAKIIINNNDVVDCICKDDTGGHDCKCCFDLYYHQKNDNFFYCFCMFVCHHCEGLSCSSCQEGLVKDLKIHIDNNKYFDLKSKHPEIAEKCENTKLLCSDCCTPNTEEIPDEIDDSGHSQLLLKCTKILDKL